MSTIIFNKLAQISSNSNGLFDTKNKNIKSKQTGACVACLIYASENSGLPTQGLFGYVWEFRADNHPVI